MQFRVVLAIIMAICMCGILSGCGRRSFDVTESLDITFEGYDGYGVCMIGNEYDWINDIADWYDDTADEEQSDKFKEETAYELLDVVTYEMTPSENLSNGDTVIISAKIGSDAEGYAFDLVGKDITITVEGLEKVETVDPFENVTVVYDGTAPNGVAKVESKNNDGSITYELDKNSKLSNGDVITVTASSGYDMSTYVQRYGKVFSETEKSFTVEGLPSYVMSIDEIPDDIQQKIQKQTYDAIQADCAGWREGNSLKESEFVGYYLLTLKDTFTSSNQNILYCVYKNTASVTGLKRGGDGKTEETGEETYYTYQRYTNIMMLPDGTCSVNLGLGRCVTIVLRAIMAIGIW